VVSGVSMGPPQQRMQPIIANASYLQVHVFGIAIDAFCLKWMKGHFFLYQLQT
jgi:hypothetical protein